MMKPESLHAFRLSLLNVLDQHGSAKFGLTPDAIIHFLPIFGFHGADRAEVVKQLHYLAGEPLLCVEPVDKKEFSPEVRSWRITTRGMNHLADQINE